MINQQYIDTQFCNFDTIEHKRALPPEEVNNYFPKDDDILYYNPKKEHKTIRFIFENVEYLPYEKEKLEEFYKYIEKWLYYVIKNKNMIDFPKDLKESTMLRFLRTNNYNFKTSLEKLNKYLEWKSNFYPFQLTNNIKNIINMGFFYFHGRDHRYRPILVINTNVYLDNSKKFPPLDWERAIMYLLDYAIEYLMIPGKIENWVVLFDLGKINIFNFPSEIKKFIVKLNENYQCRLKVLYLINSKSFITLLSKAVKRVIDKNTCKKIKILESSKINEIFKDIHPSQIERKYGGLAENVDNMFFPPRMPSDQYLLENEKKENVLCNFEEVKNIIPNDNSVDKTGKKNNLEIINIELKENGFNIPQSN
jgi:hypothetical protein